jgi:hypothetical protein
MGDDEIAKNLAERWRDEDRRERWYGDCRGLFVRATDPLKPEDITQDMYVWALSIYRELCKADLSDVPSRWSERK